MREKQNSAVVIRTLKANGPGYNCVNIEIDRNISQYCPLVLYQFDQLNL